MSLRDRLEKAAEKWKKLPAAEKRKADAELKRVRERLYANVEWIVAAQEELTGGSVDYHVVLQDVADSLNVSVFDLEHLPAAEFDAHVRAILWRKQRDAKRIPDDSATEACIDDVIRKKFRQVWKSKGTQNERADSIAKQVTEQQWQEFSKSRGISKDKRAYFYKLILECDGGRSPKWLEI